MEIEAMTSGVKKLLRESEWMRVFKIENEEKFIYESKFLFDDLRISLLDIQRKWPELSLSEKIEFSTAFGSQPPRDSDDQAILRFLMQSGPREVWRNITILIPFLTDTDEGSRFLIEGLQGENDSRANYYQAIELIRGTQAIPILRRHFEEFQTILARKEEESVDVGIWSDYLQCTRTLFVLTQDAIYLSALRRGHMSAPEKIRAYATNLLRDLEEPKN